MPDTIGRVVYSTARQTGGLSLSDGADIATQVKPPGSEIFHLISLGHSRYAAKYARANTFFWPGDVIVTGPQGVCNLEFFIGGRVYIPPNAVVLIQGERDVRQLNISTMQSVKGAVRALRQMFQVPAAVSLVAGGPFAAAQIATGAEALSIMPYVSAIGTTAAAGMVAEVAIPVFLLAGLLYVATAPSRGPGFQLMGGGIKG